MTAVLIILALAVVCFVFEVFSVDVVGLLLIVALLVSRELGFIDPTKLSVDDVIGGFSDPALITIGCMFVLSAGLTRTGAVEFVGAWMSRKSGGREANVLLLSMSVVVVFSAFMSNTAVVVIFVPILLGIARRTGTSASRFLIPLSYAAIAGGACTLIGTSTNLLVAGISNQHLDQMGEPLGMFEFAKLGIVFVALALTYMMLIGRRLLPDRTTVTSTLGGGSYTEYLTEFGILPTSSAVGKKLGETRLANRPKFSVLQVIVGEEINWNPGDDYTVQAGDVFLVKGEVSEILRVSRGGVQLVPELKPPEGEKVSIRDLTLAELALPPGSPLEGRTAREIGFRKRFGVALMAIQRRGSHLRQKVADIHLKTGDTLLVQTSLKGLKELGQSDEFVLLEGTHEKVIDTHLAPVALAILGLFVTLATFEVLPTVTLALSAVAAMIVTGVLTARTAYRNVDWAILLLIAGTLALGKGMDKTGAAGIMARSITDIVEPYGLMGAVAAIYLVTNVLTEVMSNAATAVIMTPIALSTAATLDLSARPLVLAVAFAASASFATPIGYQTNTFVYGAGGYKFTDFIRVGLPLNILFWITATLLIPLFYG